MFEHVRYILYNPVRKQLVENWKDYKYKGSQVYDLNELVLWIDARVLLGLGKE